MKLTPKSFSGILSIGLNLYFLVVSALLYVLAELSDFIKSDILISILGGSAILASVVALFIALAAIIKKRDQTISVIVSAAVSFLVLSYIFGLMLFT